MGAAESRSLTSTTADSSIRGRIGFHVLRVADNSPAAAAGIEPFFDYLVGVNGEALSSASMQGSATGSVEEMLAGVVDAHEDRELNLQVWSSKRAELRDVTVIPSTVWTGNDDDPSSSSQYGQGGADSQPSLLGLSLRLCNPDGALEKVWHVLEILEDSPAESAGLVPFGDYILGYAGGVLHKEADFYRLVEDHVDKPLRLFVYNADFDVTREVVIVPNRAWSATGEEKGLLGCGVGFGVLHRIPKPKPQGQGQAQVRNGGAGADGNAHDEEQGYRLSGGAAIQPSSSHTKQPSPASSKPQKQPPPPRMQASLVQPATPPSIQQQQQQQRSISPSGYNSRTAAVSSASTYSPSGSGASQAPRFGAQGFSNGSTSSSSPGSRAFMSVPQGSQYASSLQQPRSPSGGMISPRSSVAEVIAEEEE